MKNYLFILFYIVFLSGLLFGQDEILDGQKEPKQKKVKTRVEFLHFYDKPVKSSFKCQKKYYDKNGRDTLILIYSITTSKVFSKIHKKYDAAGNLIERIEYKISSEKQNNDDSLMMKKEGRKNRLRVKNENFILESVLYSIFDENGRFLNSKKYDGNMNLLNNVSVDYVLDPNGKPIEVNHHNSESKENIKIINKYDSLGNKIKFEYFTDGVLKTRMTYTYNNQKKPVKIFIERKMLKTIETEVYSYDAKGNVLTKLLFGANDSLLMSEKMKYDKKGNLVELVREPKEIKIDVQKSVVKYDKYGNVRKNLRYNGQGKLFRMHEFVYTYYH